MYQIDEPSAVASLPTPAAPGTAGYFQDENAALGQQGTIVPADFMNSLQLELLNILAAGGVSPSKTAYNQVVTAIENLIHGVSSAAIVWGGTSGGTANAQTVTTTPSLASVTPPCLILFVPGATNTGAMTLNPDGLGATIVKKRTSSGLVALAGGECQLGMITAAAFDGTQFEILLAATPFSQSLAPTTIAIPSAGGTVSVAHGFGVKPNLTRIRLVNVNAELGWSVGEDPEIASVTAGTTGGLLGIIVHSDTTNVDIIVSSSGIALLNKSTGVPNPITLTNWNFIVQAWL